MANVRMPAVAGTFYPDHPSVLREQITALFRHPLGPGHVPVVNPAGPRQLLGLVSPHAGYTYSGAVAAHAYAALAADGRPDVVVIVGPNHYGLGPAVSISLAEGWQTPLGTLPVAREVAEALAAVLPWPTVGEVAHLREHSIEVQLPFLQFLYGDSVPLVAVSLADQGPEVVRELGRALAEVLDGRNAVLIASTDLTHYQPHEIAVSQDRLALAAILRCDVDQLLEVALRRGTVCGPGAVAATLVACRALGAVRASLLKHATSGEAGGDTRHVVGYAALSLSK